jgi:hypothetical protein
MRIVILAAAALATAGSGGIAFWKTVVDVRDSPRRLDAADLDGDGDVDLFVVADGDGQAASLQVLLNDGGDFTPGWSAVQSTSSGALPFDVDLVDTDNDGDPDVLYILPTGSPYQRVNDGDAAFGAAAALPAFAARAEQEPADVDHDGDVDLVYYEEDIIGYFGTLQGNGDGGFEFDFTTETWFGLIGVDYARRFEIGEVTGDGLPDAAMACNKGLLFFKGQPPDPGHTTPGWENQLQLSSTACADVALADLNGDALLDIVATVPSLHSIVVFLARPDGAGFIGPSLFVAGSSPGAVATADLDLDGHADVIVTNPTTGRVNVLLGTGTGSFGAPEDFRVGRRPVDVVASDFDDDGDTDLAVACSQGGHVTVLLNNTAPRQPEIVGWR